MLSTSNVAVQFGAKPLFEQVTVKFSDGNRYGLIGANGSGKSTLMKVLGRDLEASAGDVMLQPGMRLGKLNQNQFGYEDERVLDVVMQRPRELWAAMTGARPDLCRSQGHRRGLHEGGGARGGVRGVRRLRRRGPRRQHSHRRRHS
jgi:ATPase subunit of ABC transporter with duplicated ATPase domains